MSRGTLQEPDVTQDTLGPRQVWPPVPRHSHGKHGKPPSSPSLGCAGPSPRTLPRLRRPWDGGRRPPRRMKHQKGSMSGPSTCGETHISPSTSPTMRESAAWAPVQLSILQVCCPRAVGQVPPGHAGTRHRPPAPRDQPRPTAPFSHPQRSNCFWLSGSNWSTVTCSSRVIDVSMPGWATPLQSWVPDISGKLGGTKCHFKENKRNGDEAGGPCTERDGWLPTALKWP